VRTSLERLRLAAVVIRVGKKEVAGCTSETLVPIFDKQIFDKWSWVAGL